MGYSLNNILAFNASHNACVSYLKDGKLNLVLEEERLSHKKHDNQPYLSLWIYLVLYCDLQIS